MDAIDTYAFEHFSDRADEEVDTGSSPDGIRGAIADALRAAEKRGRVAGLREAAEAVKSEAGNVVDDLRRGQERFPDDKIGAAQLSAMAGALFTSVKDINAIADKLEAETP